MKKLKETVLITGGAGRIGSVLAETLIKNGNKVLLGDINKKKLIKIKNKLGSKNLEIFSSNLTKKRQIDSFINFGLKKFKKIDSAVLCAYPKSKGWGVKFENLGEENLKKDLYNQLGASIVFCQRISKYFLKCKKGNLILISSIQGVQSPKFDHYDSLNMVSPIEYSAIKSGIISITKYLSKYFRKKNIRVNCVSPGGINENQAKSFKKRYRKSCNSKGLLDAKDVSKTILFLLSEGSKYISGQNIIIDDGWTL